MSNRLVFIPGVVIALFGLAWLMQGLRFLPGTFMYGSTTWIAIGSATFLLGIVLIAVGTKRKRWVSAAG